MQAPKANVEGHVTALSESTNHAPTAVFQPQKLKEIVEIIDLMGNVASRVREDNSGDLPATGGGASQQGSGQATTSARDEAIAKIPVVAIMQKKLISHLEQEIRTIERSTIRLSHSDKRGSAHALSELYRKIRRLTALIADIFEASAEMIRRFYISVFIDRQPLVVTGGSLARSDE